MFPADALNELPVPHLRQLPAQTVAGIVSGIITVYGDRMPYGLALEVHVFAESKTLHDARRVANALRGAYGMPDLSAMVEASLAEDAA
jgi:hypothetical protein